MKSKIYLIASLIFSMFLLVSCLKKPEIHLVNWKPVIAAPVINSTLTAKSLIKLAKNLTYTFDDKNLIILYYQDTINTALPSNYLLIPNINDSKSFNPELLGAPIASPMPFSMTVTSTNSYKTTVNVDNNVKINYSNLKSGNLEVKIVNETPQNVTTTVTISSLINSSGSPLILTINTNGSSLPGIVTTNLSDYKLDLNDQNVTYNTLKYSVKVSIVGKGVSTAMSSLIKLDIKFTDLKYKNIVGNFGTQTIPVANGENDINIFSKTIKGDFNFKNPELRLTFFNSYGTPSQFIINQLYGRYNTSANFDLQSSGSDVKVDSLLNRGNKNVNLNYPRDLLNLSIQTTNFVANSSNSNLTKLLSPAPKKLVYQFSVGMKSVGYNNFISENSKLQLYSQMVLPLEGGLSLYVLSDTTELSLPSIPTPTTTSSINGSVDGINFRISTENKFPFDMKIQGYFLDKNNLIIDSLINDGSLMAIKAETDLDGNSINTKSQQIDINIDNLRYQNLQSKMKKMVLQSSLVNENGKSVRVLSTYTLKFLMGVAINANLQGTLKSPGQQ